MGAKLQSTCLFDDRGIPYLFTKDSLFYDILVNKWGERQFHVFIDYPMIEISTKLLL